MDTRVRRPRRTVATLVVLLACVCHVAQNKALGRPEMVNGEPESFGRRIQRVISESKYVEHFDDELFTHPLMQEVFNASERFRSDAQTYILRHPELSRVQARVSLVALQCLPLDDYLNLVDRMATAENGAISKWALFYSVVPGFESSTRLAMGFRDQRIRKVLEKAARSPNATAALRTAIADILDGSSARQLQERGWTPTLRCPRGGRA